MGSPRVSKGFPGVPWVSTGLRSIQESPMVSKDFREFPMSLRDGYSRLPPPSWHGGSEKYAVQGGFCSTLHSNSMVFLVGINRSVCSVLWGWTAGGHLSR